MAGDNDIRATYEEGSQRRAVVGSPSISYMDCDPYISGIFDVACFGR